MMFELSKIFDEKNELEYKYNQFNLKKYFIKKNEKKKNNWYSSWFWNIGKT